MVSRTLIVLMLILAFALPAVAQEKLMERAERHYEEMSYPNAIELYLKIVRENKNNKKAIIRLAECYRLVNDNRNAQRWYARAVKQKGIKPEMFFHYGQVLMINRKYKQAIPWFENYQRKIPDDNRTADMIEACRNFESFKDAAGLYKVRRLNINSEASDFGPVFFGKEIVFASARKRQMFNKYNRTGQGYLDLYKTAYSGNYNLGEPELFRGRINTPYHEATPTFSKDGKEMFFTRNNYLQGKMGPSKQGIVNLATYHAVFVDGKWQRESPLPFNSEEYSIGHPCLTADGKRLYFVSNMPGGFGGTDLYYAAREGDDWLEPVNLGAAVNTQGNEMFPVLNAEGQLSFASNGHAGQGGLDVYFATEEQDSFIGIRNAGAPVNSASDDFGMIYDPENNIGFFTSNRPGGKGDDDIYAFFKLVPLLGTVLDEQGNPIADVTVSIGTGRGFSRIGTNEEGAFIYGLQEGRDYKLIFNKVGFEELELSLTTKGVSVEDKQEPRVILKAIPAEK